MLTFEVINELTLKGPAAEMMCCSPLQVPLSAVKTADRKL